MTSTQNDAPLAIGIDVGATKIVAALVDRRGIVVTERRTLTLVKDGPEAVIGRMAKLVSELQQAAALSVVGIGIGTPGYVDPKRGVVSLAVNMNWRDVNVVDLLTAKLDERMNIYVENDANVLALGEYYFGAAQEQGDFVYVSVGSGLGSGLMVNHALVHGVDFRAAELGHLPLDTNGRQCVCGLRGCTETVVSGPGILATAKEMLMSDRASSLRIVDELTPETILQEALAGDTLAGEVFEYTGQWLGHALSICAALLNPSQIVIGGGMGLAAYDLLVPGVLREMGQRCIEESIENLKIVCSQVHSSAVGASSLVWHADQ